MKSLCIVLVLSCFAAAAAAKPSNQDLQEAINFIDSMMASNEESVSGNTWQSRFVKVLSLLKNHSVYSKWLLEDEFSAAAAARHLTPSATPKFSCDLKKSATVPTSVHRLQPGDVKVIGAVGDSLTAANGARATNVLGLLTEYRGYAWSIGGEKQLKDHTTLANILRAANSNLYGHSLSSGKVQSSGARLNVAEPGKKAVDMPGQAKRLVEKMRSDRNVDFENDWKVITLFIGGNDLCDYCQDKKQYSPSNYIKHIKEALDYFHANVPKAFVNVAEVLDVALVQELKDGSSTCRLLLGSFLCKCAANPSSAEELKQVINDYQRLLRELVASGRYDTRDDFTVVNQPFYRDSAPPRNNGKYDLSFFAPDCFHFSQKGHDEAAKSLWNNMLEPVGKKSSKWNPGGPFLCPSSSRPYFMTSKNS